MKFSHAHKVSRALQSYGRSGSLIRAGFSVLFCVHMLLNRAWHLGFWLVFVSWQHTYKNEKSWCLAKGCQKCRELQYKTELHRQDNTTGQIPLAKLRCMFGMRGQGPASLLCLMLHYHQYHKLLSSPWLAVERQCSPFSISELWIMFCLSFKENIIIFFFSSLGYCMLLALLLLLYGSLFF